MRRMLVVVLILCCVLPILSKILDLDHSVILVTALLGLASALSWGLYAIRCPACFRNLSMFPRGNSIAAIKFCPYCAVSVDDEL